MTLLAGYPRRDPPTKPRLSAIADHPSKKLKVENEGVGAINLSNSFKITIVMEQK
jgi:hypothetical protein